MRRRSLLLSAGLVLAIAACGGGGGSNDDPTGPNDPSGPNGPNGPNNPSNPTGPTATNGSLTAVIQGARWNAAGQVVVNREANTNFLGIAASGWVGNVGGTAYSLVIGLGAATGPGTYSVTYLNPAGSQIVVGSQTGGWGSFFQGGTGTVTITVLTANRVAGTFSGDLMPGTGGATGVLTLREGAFDVTH